MSIDARFLIWDIVAMAWTEIGLENEDYPEITAKLKESAAAWNEINQIAVQDVCASFAWDTFLIFPCMLWVIMPDWGYDEEYLRNRMIQWGAKPKWFHFLNSFRLLA